jgi:hypothetical protein
MPLGKIDYTYTIIYKIVCKDLNIKDTFVGSTTDFTRCKARHKNLVVGKAFSYIRKRETNKKLYDSIINNGSWPNWDMVEIEKYPCFDSREAHGRVRYYIEKLNANLNCVLFKTCKEREPIDYLDRYGPPGSGEREAYIKFKLPHEKFDPTNRTVAYLATHKQPDDVDEPFEV